MAARSAVALLSGGLDSGTSLGMWLAEPECTLDLCLTFDYGQRSAAAEMRAAQRLAARFDVPWQAVELPWLARVARDAGSALVDDRVELPQRIEADPGDETSAAAVWVPARNVVFLSVGAAFAEARRVGALLTGFNREEARTFPDNSAAFVRAVDRVLSLGTRNGVTVCSPTIDLDKVAIVRRARELGLGHEDFWSCYQGGAKACGTCESCVRSRIAWGQ